MNSNVSVNTLARESNIGLMEILANEKSKNQAYLKMIQLLVGVVEYLLYILTFVIYFTWKVVPDYSAFSSRFWEWPSHVTVFMDYIWFLSCFFGIYLIMMYQQQFYNTSKERNLSDEIVIIVKTVIISFMITIGITFLLKNTMVYSRVMLILFVGSVVIEAVLIRYLRKRTFYLLKKSGRLKQNILIVGAGRVGRQLQDLFGKTDAHGLQLVGFLDDRQQEEGVIGAINDLERVVHSEKVDIIYVTIPSERNKINPLLQRVYKYQVDIRIIPEMYDHMSSVYEYRQDYDYPCLQIVKTPLRGFNLVIKRFMDLTLSVLGVLVLLPFFIIISIGIKSTSKGPVFYKQKRLGKNGTPFTMYKFRSMVTNADSIKNELTASNEMKGPAFKMKLDPRVTKLGSFLRKYSIDEFPQLFNVLKGEMSLIGPRPPLPEEVQRYTDLHWRRMDVRPGMTGLWQVSGRSNLTFEEWVNLDIQYIERWSIALEFKIILRTIPVVVKGSGAY
jgi:exopolysaccharide biosynthesis polyprenyl glycosylphosphotransferase